MNRATSTGQGRPWLRAFATVILTLASILSFASSAVLFRYLGEGKAAANDHRIQQLFSRVEHLSQQVDSLQHQPASVAMNDFTAARQALDMRLSKLEQDRSMAELDQRIDALQVRVERLQARRSPTFKPSLRPSRRTEITPADAPASAVAPSQQALPFRVLGLEVRGGERFVSVLPDNATGLGQVRLLRPGDSQAAWRLESIEDDAAIFQSLQAGAMPPGAASQMRRLALPSSP